MATSSDLTFVNRADLTARRPPPRLSPLAALLRDGGVKRLTGVIYFIALLLLWDPLLAALGIMLPVELDGILFTVAICAPLIAVTLLDGLRTQVRTGTPFYRDVAFLRNAGEIVLLFLIVQAGVILFGNLQTNLARSGLVIDFGVIGRTFGVEITEGPDPGIPLDVPLIGAVLAEQPLFRPDTVLRALITGFANTVSVSSLSLIATTLLGLFIGVGLLSRNWLVRTVANVYTEIFRNTPLLVQLFFLYGGVIKALPPRPREAVELIPGAMYVSGRGFYYPALVSGDNSSIITVALLIGVVLALVLWRWRVSVHEQTGQPANVWQYILSAIAGCGLVGLLIASAQGGFPYSLNLPEVGNFNFSGGASLSAEYLTLFLGLTLYTAAFIADIVRAGIQSVHKGQIEAARALGLNNGQTLNKVVLPQALRLAVPPLTNQYLNLVKNSSLGIAIGFTDLYNVGTIAYNQTGQSVAMFAIMAVIYLTVSLTISFVMNLFNGTLALKTR
ncbi:MAG: ABC transporter permease subunit [Chloroflexota bacterium]|nr:ABC transporter permease subunit [Chloroflexota bacterium]